MRGVKRRKRRAASVARVSVDAVSRDSPDAARRRIYHTDAEVIDRRHEDVAISWVHRKTGGIRKRCVGRGATVAEARVPGAGHGRGHWGGDGARPCPRPSRDDREVAAAAERKRVCRSDSESERRVLLGRMEPVWNLHTTL